MKNITPLLLKHQQKLPHGLWLILSLLILGVTNNWQTAQAQIPESAQPVPAAIQNPPIPSIRNEIAQTIPKQVVIPSNSSSSLKNLLTQMDAAASQGNIKAVMQLYSPNFTSGDGLNFQSLEKSLLALWKQYPQLRYSTQLQSWKTQGNSMIAETVTNITGLPSANSNDLALNATITSRQTITGGKIVSQEILAENTRLTSGNQPPQVEINLPQQVKVGQMYYFDAIVQEPVGDDFLLGSALEEPVQASKYLKPTSVDLELLTTGGLFKVGRAPSTPGNHWVSAVILRGNGVTMVTQRLRVVK
ncbi:nuclear transport factor 2 family protein [Nodularia harveyana UHCC-0300]|uniref:Nuclear transport factor 2 family protein n=1 Tax=Nodularia harveyana UHCC-0300 TaxID=2974287 RepID=A0ABU5UGV9_9CYAN|nr:nuclear transport factor 2 family protein [Nodularia harveyana]MEA5582568.1 nuclear transport factor 2 family protein [Nodularia harveyana UHCC-0300]